MRVRRVLGGVAWSVAAMLGSEGAAQDAGFEAAMEVQRCIWSCLANSPGAESPEYGACVARICDGSGGGEPAAGASSGAPAGSWSVGQGLDGRPYAAVTTPGFEGEAGIYVQCGGGRGSVSLGGFDGGTADMALRIGEASFDLPMGPSGYPEVGLTRFSALYAALVGGSSAEVIGPDGGAVATFSLRGSAAALGALGGGC